MADELSSQPLPDSDPEKKPFNPEVLDKTVIAVPLLRKLRKAREEAKVEAKPEEGLYDVIIDLNLKYRGGVEAARDEVNQLIAAVKERLPADSAVAQIDENKS